MKIIHVFILSCLPLLLKAQLYIGTSIGTSNQVFQRVHLEYNTTNVRTEVAYLTNFEEHYLQLKLGGGFRKGAWGFYWYLPYMNYKLGVGYNTPFSTEVFYSNWCSFNVDVYKDTVIPSIRLKLLVVK